MDTLLFRVCGLDVHKKFVMACVRITDRETGQVTNEVRRFGTMTVELETLRDWLKECQVSDVAMESTGVYWKPIWNILEGHVSLLLANPHELKQVPGRKSDPKDAQWIAHLLACGLLTPSYVPQQAQRELRDLTRYRTTLLDDRTRVVNRVHKVLEDANIKLSSVASDILGASGRDMLQALIDGKKTPDEMAELARGRLHAKLEELRQALHGHFTEHHRFMLQNLLEHLRQLETQIDELSRRIQERLRPFLPVPLERHLDAVPGVAQRTIEVLVAELGSDMKAFPTSSQAASWVGLVPTNEQSAGKIKRRRIKPGNRWLKRALVEAARAAARAKTSYFSSQYARLASRRGRNRAAIAVAHSLLIVLYELIKHPDLTYQDLGPNYFDKRDPERLRRHLIKRLQALGYEVTITPTTAS